MSLNKQGNLLLVSNYPSDTAYAWWLMEVFWKALADLFFSRGAKVYLAYPEINSTRSAIQESGIEIVEMNISGNAKDRSRVLEFIRRKNIQTIYFTDRSYFSVSYAFFRKAGVKNIYIHDHTPGDRPFTEGLKGYVKALRNRLPLITADKVFAISPLMRERSLRNGRVPAKKVFTVQNGIPPIEIRTLRSEVRKKLKIPDDAIVSITCGRAHPYKRFDLVIDAANLLKQKAPNLNMHFLLVGDGPDFELLKDKVTTEELNEFVHLLGFRDDVADLLGASDFAVHAALGEGFSLAILEYMSAGLPPFLPDIPSVKQAITHQETGVVYKNSEDLVEKIQAVLGESNKLQRLGAAAKKKVNEDYTLEQCVASLLYAFDAPESVE